MRFLLFLCLLTAVAKAGPALLVISLDGVRPDYISDADKYSLKIPYLRELTKTGAHASGVRGVLPTVTYPSHTTMLTGVWPAKHGIYSNKPFDPTAKHPDPWYWYSEDIRVPTVWDAAAGAGYVVAAVGWPVSVGAKNVQFNIPEYNETRTDLDLKMTKALATPALMDELAAKAGPFVVDADEALPRDWARTKYGVELIRQKHVRFMTIHLAAPDHIEHRDGPFAPKVLESIEEMDKMVKALSDAILAEDSKAVICIVSDHGFAKVDHVLKLDWAFVHEGLITLHMPRESLNASGVREWVAMPWHSGGSTAVVLKDPNDAAAKEKVKAFLDRLAGDPKNGIEKILGKADIEKLGGAPTADFWIDVKPGFMNSGALSGALVEPTRPCGTHGYVPTHEEMNAMFIIAGNGIRENVDLGKIDMRNFAPTFAKIMGVTLKDAELPALDVFK